MLTKMIIATALMACGAAAFANQTSTIVNSITLQDGSTVHVFSDGKMAMEDSFGRSVSMKEGQAMQARDGRSIAMVGNETARLDSVRRTQLGGAR